MHLDPDIQAIVDKARLKKEYPSVRVRTTYHECVEAIEGGPDSRLGYVGFAVAGDYPGHTGQDFIMAAIGQEITSLGAVGKTAQVVPFSCWDDTRGFLLVVNDECYRVYWYEISKLYVDRDRPTNPKAKPATKRNTATKKGN
nr:hypothetical protein [Rhodococcus sp. (in: high G+C Gram-positive bacteria)]